MCVCVQPDVLNHGDDADGYLDEYAKVRFILRAYELKSLARASYSHSRLLFLVMVLC